MVTVSLQDSGAYSLNMVFMDRKKKEYFSGEVWARAIVAVLNQLPSLEVKDAAVDCLLRTLRTYKKRRALEKKRG